MPKESVAMTLARWEQILAAWEANAEDLGHIQEYRGELQGLAERIKELSVEQEALNARKQQVTRDLDAAKERGREIAVRIRTGLRSCYGMEGEKLTEFGLRPRRGRRSRDEGETPVK